MESIRKISSLIRSQPVVEGAGVHLKRVFGHGHSPQFDPFLLLDDFHSDQPELYLKGFPWHPHRGIETITYILHGQVEHGDNLGNAGVICPGDVQWMTAGSGIIHQEMPKGDGDRLLWGFQLWANLPASHKMMPPRYQEIDRLDVPELTLEDGVKIKIICGKIGSVQGPVENIVIAPEFLDVTIPPETTWNHRVSPDHTVLAYVIDGKILFLSGQSNPHLFQNSHEVSSLSDSFIHPETLAMFGPGEIISLQTADNSARFLLISGMPLREPVAWHGPIVMNTEEELRTAFEEYRDGTFIKNHKTEN